MFHLHQLSNTESTLQGVRFYLNGISEEYWTSHFETLILEGINKHCAVGHLNIGCSNSSILIMKLNALFLEEFSLFLTDINDGKNKELGGTPKQRVINAFDILIKKGYSINLLK